MDLYVVLIVAVAGMCIIFFLARIFIKQPTSQTNTKLYFDLLELERHGFVFNNYRYEGMYRGFPVTVFATPNMQGSDLAIVMVATDTQSGPIDFLKTFISGFFKNPDNGGCTYVGFRLLMQLFNDPSHGAIGKLDRLIDLLDKKSIRPFPIG